VINTDDHDIYYPNILHLSASEVERT
jgi:hypothetical protein